MLANVTILEALVYKEKLAAIDGVESVSWLDYMIGLDTLKLRHWNFGCFPNC